MKQLREFQTMFDVRIFEFLKKKKDEFIQIDPEASIFMDILSEFIQNGGKRIRPALFYFTTKSYKGNLDDALMRSMSFEFFQAFCLIHDDIIDKSELRRGNPTVHTKYGQNTAILVGDMALMIADEIFFSLDCSDKVIKTYNSFKQEVLMGEYLDSIGSKNTQKVMELKTARYTFVRPVELALQLLDLDPNKIDRWKNVLLSIGNSFQLKDDLIGVFGDEKIIGKSSDSDLQERKYTRLIKLFEQEATSSERVAFNQLFKKSTLSHNDCQMLRKMLENKKVPQQVKQQIHQDIITIKQELQSIHELALHGIIYEVLFIIDDMDMVHV
ncbi:MAG: polyprenyl synthetase family protein [Candidatus Roizmanbacteria bacterium]|nr:polyprenyl synthetase family protein [Candidatus Roizmanbacteria bacterium]